MNKRLVGVLVGFILTLVGLALVHFFDDGIMHAGPLIAVGGVLVGVVSFFRFRGKEHTIVQ